MASSDQALAEDIFKVLLKNKKEQGTSNTNNAAPLAVDELEISLNQFTEEKEEDDDKSDQTWGKNWRQFTSVLPGIIYLLSFGIQFDWCVRELDIKSPKPLFFMDEDLYANKRLPFRRDLVTFINLNSWYVGAILGGIFGAILVPSFKKSSIYFLSGALMILSAGIFLYLSPTSSDSAGRILFGFSYGLVQLTVIVHVSDIATKQMRSAILRKIVYIVFLSTVLSQLALIVTGYHWGWKAPRPLGPIEILAVAIIGLILTPILTNETVPYLLLHKQEENALKLMAKLCAEQQPSRHTQNRLEEYKLRIEEDKIIGKNIFDRENFIPLFAVINAKLLSSILWNVPMILILMNLYKDLIEGPHSFLALGLNEIIQIALGAVALCISSFWGEHRLFYWLCLVSSGIVLLCTVPYVYTGYQNEILPIQSLLVIVVFGLISVGVTASQWIHTAQSFSILKKPWSIAIATLIEYVVHIGFITIYYFIQYPQPIFWTIITAGLILIPIILLTLLPKLTKLLLRDTRNTFNKVTKSKILGHDNYY